MTSPYGVQCLEVFDLPLSFASPWHVLQIKTICSINKTNKLGSKSFHPFTVTALIHVSSAWSYQINEFDSYNDELWLYSECPMKKEFSPGKCLPPFVWMTTMLYFLNVNDYLLEQTWTAGVCFVDRVYKVKILLISLVITVLNVT